MWVGIAERFQGQRSRFSDGDIHVIGVALRLSCYVMFLPHYLLISSFLHELSVMCPFEYQYLSVRILNELDFHTLYT